MGGGGAKGEVVTDIVKDFDPTEGDTVRFRFKLSEAHIDARSDYTKITNGSKSVKFEGDFRGYNWATREWSRPEPAPTPAPEPVVEVPVEPAPEPEVETPAEPTVEPEAKEPTEAKPRVPTKETPDSTDGFNVIDGRNPAEGAAQELSGTNGRDWLRGSDGKDALRGNSGRDYLEGNNGNDFLSGGNARDWLVGGRGGDRLQGGKQGDILTGGTGKDTFVFKAKHGADIVTDFSVGKDTLELHGVEFSDLTIKKWAKGTGARVEWDEGVIFLEGVQRDSLTEDDFLF